MVQLSQTKEELKNILDKIQVLDFCVQQLNGNHPTFQTQIQDLFYSASNHKMKLIDEVLRLSGAEKLTAPVVEKKAPETVQAQ